MYSIYVTNKTNSEELYIRLQHEKLSIAIPSFHHDLDKLKDEKGNVSSYLIRWGFCLIPPQHTMPFAIDVATDGTKKYASLYANSKLWTMDYEVNCLRKLTTYQTMSFTVDVTSEGPWKYASLYAGSKLWTMDIEMNCLRYGCLFVNRTETRQKPLVEEYSLYPANPQPVWIPFEVGCPLPENIIKPGSQGNYFGRSAEDGGFPCKVTSTVHSGFQLEAICDTGNSRCKVTHGALLRNTGHEFVPANTGDPVPPHAVIGGVGIPEGSLYLGRVGGNTPCAITAEGGKIKQFCYNYSKKVQSGEILILTNDPNI